MRLLVLVTLAAVASADVSHLAGYSYNSPASSYGVPQSSVTERQFSATSTSPSPSLHLPAFEHQDFNAFNPLPGAVISTTAAPFVDANYVSSTPAPIDLASLVSSTPAPAVLGYGGLGFNAQLPSFGSGLSYTTAAPSLSVSSGDFGLQSVSQLGGLGSNVVSSTAAPSVAVTSGSQENLGFNHGFNSYTTPAPALFSTVAPSISTIAPGFNFNSGYGLGSAYSFPGFNSGFGFNGFSTPAPLLGSGGLTAINPNLFSSDAAANSVNIHGITSGGSINDAFGISALGHHAAGVIPQSQQVSRHLYFYAAPEDPEPARTRINISPVPPPRKNVKIIFIKAPAPPAPAPISIAAPAQDEEKTLVYVLVKKPEETQNIEIQPAPPAPPSKPEVFFIKYKTPQEAEEAISKVQSSHAEGSVAGPSIPAESISGSAILGSINGEGSFGTSPFLNYVSTTTTTPSPLLNFIGGGISGPIIDSGFRFGNQLDDADISQNLISSGGHTSSLFSTGSPLIGTLSTGDGGIFSTTTASPLAPHVTYGPPIYKKK